MHGILTVLKRPSIPAGRLTRTVSVENPEDNSDHALPASPLGGLCCHRRMLNVGNVDARKITCVFHQQNDLMRVVALFLRSSPTLAHDKCAVQLPRGNHLLQDKSQRSRVSVGRVPSLGIHRPQSRSRTNL